MTRESLHKTPRKRIEAMALQVFLVADAPPIPRPTNIVEAIEHIRSEMVDIPLDAFEGD